MTRAPTRPPRRSTWNLTVKPRPTARRPSAASAPRSRTPPLADEEAPDVAAASFACEEEGCDQEFPTKARLGYHRWRDHGITGLNHKKNATAKAKPKAPAKAPTAKKEVAPRVQPERRP